MSFSPDLNNLKRINLYNKNLFNIIYFNVLLFLIIITFNTLDPFTRGKFVNCQSNNQNEKNKVNYIKNIQFGIDI